MLIFEKNVKIIKIPKNEELSKNLGFCKIKIFVKNENMTKNKKQE